MHKASIIVLIILLSCCKQKHEESQVLKKGTKTAIDSLTIALQKIHERGHINGFSVAIVNNSTTLYTRGFGHANIATERLYTQNTVQNIASISKTFIGLSLLKAMEMGKLGLDDPINQYLPYAVSNPNHPKMPITIRHLATHTSSIRDTDFYKRSYVMKDSFITQEITGAKIPDYFNKVESRISMPEFLKRTLSTEGAWYQNEGFLDQGPGERFEYSNIGATLAARVLELATGMSFPEFTRTYILEPLEMTDSGWSFSTINFENHSRLYADTKTLLPFYSLITYPDGGFITSSTDLAKYLNELIKGHSGEGTLLKAESYKQLFQKQLQPSHFVVDSDEQLSEDENNSGIFMAFMNDSLIGHSGGDPGISSRMFFNPNSLTGFILIVNTDLGDDGYQEFLELWEVLENYGTKLNK